MFLSDKFPSFQPISSALLTHTNCFCSSIYFISATSAAAPPITSLSNSCSSSTPIFFYHIQLITATSITANIYSSYLSYRCFSYSPISFLSPTRPFPTSPTPPPAALSASCHPLTSSSRLVARRLWSFPSQMMDGTAQYTRRSQTLISVLCEPDPLPPASLPLSIFFPTLFRQIAHVATSHWVDV